MGRFNASLRLPGETEGLTAVVELNEGRLRLASGEHVIGDWELSSVELEPGPNGVRLRVEGETLLLDIENRSAFEEETATARKVEGGRRAKKRARVTTARKAETVRRPKQTPSAATRRPEPESEAKPERGSRIDAALAAAQRRLGPILPDWVFTRGGAVVVLAAIALAVFLAELVSMLLLILGVVILLIAGVCMLDSVIAARVLRHKVTPIQALIIGGSVFVAGLLVGMVA